MNYQVMPELTAEEYSELKNDILERGVMIPIEFDEFGNILDGHHRLKICQELDFFHFRKFYLKESLVHHISCWINKILK